MCSQAITPHWSSLALGTDLNLEAAVLLAQASEAAYNDKISPTNWSQQHRVETLVEFDHGNIQGFWVTKGEESILCFRGTSNLGQWIRDFRFLPTAHPWGEVHLGFLDGLGNVKAEVERFSRSMRLTSRIWITGHSLGGALAVLAAASLRSNGLEARVYTFGQPRVGLSTFSERFDIEFPKRMVRFINQSDIIPRIPPGPIYRHTGIAKRIVRSGKLESREAEQSQMQVSESELPPLTLDEFTLLQKSLQMEANLPWDAKSKKTQLEGNLSIFADHSISDYIMLLDELRLAKKPENKL